MNRRQLVFAIISSTVTAGAAVYGVARGNDSPAVVLHEIYERETERHNKRLPADNAAFYDLFTREMRELMNAPRPANPRVTARPILHALFGRGVLPGTHVILSGVTTTRSDDGIAMLNVALTVYGAIRELAVTVLRQDGAWRISEIVYGHDDTLTAHYRRTTER
jgi:hypothetical protein